MWNRILLWGLTASALAIAAGMALILLDGTAYPGLLNRTWNSGGWLLAVGIICGGNLAIFNLLSIRRR